MPNIFLEDLVVDHHLSVECAHSWCKGQSPQFNVQNYMVDEIKPRYGEPVSFQLLRHFRKIK